jgi:hypothetical protein
MNCTQELDWLDVIWMMKPIDMMTAADRSRKVDPSAGHSSDQRGIANGAHHKTSRAGDRSCQRFQRLVEHRRAFLSISRSDGQQNTRLISASSERTNAEEADD